VETQPDNHNDAVVISVKGLYKSFNSNHVLKGVDLELHKGENVIVMGRSGIGKSVLIKIIAGLIKPDSGSVKVLCNEISKINTRDLNALRLKMGFLFQNGALYDSLSVGENVEFPLVRNIKTLTRQERRTTVNKALDAVGLLETIDRYPSELSGGQQKRIGIARMLVMRPQIILYDEPTAGLDPLTCVEINNLILKVKEISGASSIVITHDLTCAKVTGDRILMMENGKFIREGNFEEVFSTDDEQIKGFYDYNFIL
jgi:phospholipid/cholesterol/gamma-HCH transport system ATP-binding protein